MIIGIVQSQPQRRNQNQRQFGQNQGQFGQTQGQGQNGGGGGGDQGFGGNANGQVAIDSYSFKAEDNGDYNYQ